MEVCQGSIMAPILYNAFCIGQDEDAKPQSTASSILQSPKWWLAGHDNSLHLQIEIERQNCEMGLSKTNEHIIIKIEMSNFCQEPPVSSKAPNEDLKDMDGLCNFKNCKFILMY